MSFIYLPVPGSATAANGNIRAIVLPGSDADKCQRCWLAGERAFVDRAGHAFVIAALSAKDSGRYAVKDSRNAIDRTDCFRAVLKGES
jgi:hypothetical protein